MVVNHRQKDCLEFKACWPEVITRPTMTVWKDPVSEKAKEEAKKEGQSWRPNSRPQAQERLVTAWEATEGFRRELRRAVWGCGSSRI